jgi:hypothetical protein
MNSTNVTCNNNAINQKRRNKNISNFVKEDEERRIQESNKAYNEYQKEKRIEIEIKTKRYIQEIIESIELRDATKIESIIKEALLCNIDFKYYLNEELDYEYKRYNNKTILEIAVNKAIFTKSTEQQAFNEIKQIIKTLLHCVRKIDILFAYCKLLVICFNKERKAIIFSLLIKHSINLEINSKTKDSFYFKVYDEIHKDKDLKKIFITLLKENGLEDTAKNFIRTKNKKLKLKKEIDILKKSLTKEQKIEYEQKLEIIKNKFYYKILWNEDSDEDQKNYKETKNRYYQDLVELLKKIHNVEHTEEVNTNKLYNKFKALKASI